MKDRQNIVKIMGIIIVLVLIGLLVWSVINQNKKKENMNQPTPSVTPTSSATPIPTKAPIVTPTLDSKLSDEEKAIQVILNQGVYQKKDLEFIEKTDDGLFKIEIKKGSSAKKKTYYLVDITTQNYEILSELVEAGSST